MSYPLDLHKIPRSLSEQSSLFSGQETFGSSFHLLFIPLSSFFLRLHCLASQNALSYVSPLAGVPCFLCTERHACPKHLFLLPIGDAYNLQGSDSWCVSAELPPGLPCFAFWIVIKDHLDMPLFGPLPYALVRAPTPRFLAVVLPRPAAGCLSAKDITTALPLVTLPFTILPVLSVFGPVRRPWSIG